MTTHHYKSAYGSDDKDMEKEERLGVSYEQYANRGISNEDATFFTDFSPEKHKKLLRKIDFRLVPVLALLYLAAHIDRANIGSQFQLSCFD